MANRVLVDGADKGEVAFVGGRWQWTRNNGGVETWKKGSHLADVKGDIARLCLSTPDKIRLRKSREV